MMRNFYSRSSEIRQSRRRQPWPLIEKARVLLASVMICCSPGPLLAASPHTAIDEVVSQYAQVREFSGVVLVDRAKARRYFRTTGLAERSFGAPNTMATRFQIASISKLFVGVSVLQLVETGRIALDGRLDEYIPSLPPSLAGMTVDSLLTHTSGLPSEAEFEPWETLGLDEHVRRIGRLAVNTNHVGQYHYSNSGYVLLAKLIEVVSGQRYDEYLNGRVLKPAGLNDTGFIIGDQTIPGLAVGYARGRNGWHVPWRARHRGIYAPGGLYSTAEDLQRVMNAINGTLLTAATRDTLWKQRVPTGSPNQWASYGGVINERQGKHYVLVAGSGDGAKAAVLHVRETGLLAVILSNNGNVPVTEMVRDIVVAVESGKAPVVSACAVPSAAQMRSSVGMYDFTGSGLARLNGVEQFRVAFAVDGQRAFLIDLADDSATMLCEMTSGQLRLVDTAEVKIGFSVGPQGKTEMNLRWGTEDFRAEQRAVN